MKLSELYTTNKTELENNQGYVDELSKLSIKERNKVRAILNSKRKDSIRLINKIRKEYSAYSLARIEKALRSDRKPNKKDIIPSLYPKDFQVYEEYERLTPLELEKQLEIINTLCFSNLDFIKDCIVSFQRLSSNILNQNLERINNDLRTILDKFGASFILLRKIIFIYSTTYQDNMPIVSEIVNKYNRNIVCKALIQFYKEDHDLVNIKKAFLGIRTRSGIERYTQDLIRTIFHPYARNENDFSEMLYSSLQSSFIDAIVMCKLNENLINKNKFYYISQILEFFEENSESVANLASYFVRTQKDNSQLEKIFYQHSSAWMENSKILLYKKTQDHLFYDQNSQYIDNKNMPKDIIEWIENANLDSIAKNRILTNHNVKHLEKIESSGMITKSSAFNYIINTCNAKEIKFLEDDLFSIMGNTADLSKTINTDKIRNILKENKSISLNSKLIFNLLLTKKDKNEKDEFNLRKIIEKEVIQSFENDFVKYLSYLDSKSKAVSEFVYDICTEDFLAKMTVAISKTHMISETRANLHNWMGTIKNEQSYFDRARMILIDGKINRVRDQIDDYRIYVDTTKFCEWINDEIIRDLISILINIADNKLHDVALDDPQLINILEKMYSEFCNNNKFGIASYLGRRIRHGTFKGNIFGGVINPITEEFNSLFSSEPIKLLWETWKNTYEVEIDNIVKNNLHIVSNEKPQGLLNPKIMSNSTILLACINDLVNEIDKKNFSLEMILCEYCWRFIEVDLSYISNFIEEKRRVLTNVNILEECKYKIQDEYSEEYKKFLIKLPKIIGEKLNIIKSWFKRPVSIAPKASLTLLYKAVLNEVKDTFPDIDMDSDSSDNDIELMGGAYHIIYDALYVILHNAGKHGKRGGKIQREFSLTHHDATNGEVIIKITSELDDKDSEEDIRRKLKINPNEDISNAQLYESRSGIRKIYHLHKIDHRFNIKNIICKDRKVIVIFSYKLGGLI